MLETCSLCGARVMLDLKKKKSNSSIIISCDIKNSTP